MPESPKAKAERKVLFNPSLENAPFSLLLFAAQVLPSEGIWILSLC